MKIEEYNVGDILRVKFKHPANPSKIYNTLLMIIVEDGTSIKKLLNLKTRLYIPIEIFKVNIISIEVKKSNYDNK